MIQCQLQRHPAAETEAEHVGLADAEVIELGPARYQSSHLRRQYGQLVFPQVQQDEAGQVPDPVGQRGQLISAQIQFNQGRQC